MISTKVKASLLSVVMTVMMVGGHVSAAVVPKDNIDPSKATVIKADQEVTVTVDGTKDEIDLYKFVPEQSGKYRIIAKKVEGKNFNPSAYFYKSDMFVLDGFSSINSSLLDITYNGYTVFLTKGETYYIQAKSGNYQVTSDYKMSLVYASADTSTKTGWIELQNKWYYFDDTGLMARGWEQAGSYWYYFGADHSMTTGWLSEKNVWYYLDKNNGNMLTGWQAINGKWYYFNPNGTMVTGWKYIGGDWYYLNAGGDMATGWKLSGGVWYYLNSSGSMKTGWLYSGGLWYYLDTSSGEMVTGSKTINGVTYVFDSNGVCTNP